MNILVESFWSKEKYFQLSSFHVHVGYKAVASVVNLLDLVPREALGPMFDSHRVLPIPWGHACGPLAPRFTQSMWMGALCMGLLQSGQNVLETTVIKEKFPCRLLVFQGILCAVVSLTQYRSVDKTMDLLFKGVKEDASECPFDVKDLQRCPFLRNINKPTCFSFSSVHLPLSVMPGAKGPIFEDGPSFDTAFKVFHGKDGIVPLSGRSNVRDDVPDFKPTPYFNPLATKAATISLSSFGPGGPFSFGSFSDKWKKQKKPDSSSNKNSSSSPEGSSSKHEALGNEWLKSGNCPIAKSYRAVSHVLPLVASALQPPPGMKFKCPPAVVAARAALARTAFVKSLRPQPLPAKMLVIAALGMAVNVPLGVWREHTTKFSLSWFTAVHAAVPFIAMLRKSVLMPKTAMALTIAASVLGQVIGSRAERFRLKQVAERGGSTVQIATAGAIPGYSPTLVDGVTVTERGQGTLQIASAGAIAGYSASQVDCGAGTHCGAEGMMRNPLPLEGSGPTSADNVCF